MDITSVLRDLNARVEALGGTFDERIASVVEEQLRVMMADDGDFARKMRFAADEPKLIGSKYARLGMSIGDVEFLYTLTEGVKGQRKVSGTGYYEGPSEELTRTFQALSGAELVADTRASDQVALDQLFASAPSSWYFGNDRARAERGDWWNTDAYKAAVRAMDTAEAGFGAQLVGAQYVRELWEVARRESRVFGLINTFEMSDPTAYLPTEVDIPEPIFASESTANNSSNYATVKTGSRRVQVDAKKFIIHQMWSGEMEEDSLVAFVPFLRAQATKSLAHFSDSLVLNGDTTNAATGNINLDDADPADTKFYLAFDGIRHLGLVDNTNNRKDVAAAISLAALQGSKARMLDTTNLVDWGHPSDMNDLVYVADPSTADQVALIDEVTTVDKYGPQASVLTGEVARIVGHPLIGSMAMSKTEADGKVSTTGSNNTKGQVVAFNRRGFVVGWRRRVRVEVERLPASDQSRIVYSYRMGFGRHLTGADATTAEQADVLYNITLP